MSILIKALAKEFILLLKDKYGKLPIDEDKLLKETIEMIARMNLECARENHCLKNSLMISEIKEQIGGYTNGVSASKIVHNIIKILDR